jgi:protein-L-isoaspartate(D-aspartate) O-methyltransferase
VTESLSKDRSPELPVSDLGLCGRAVSMSLQAGNVRLRLALALLAAALFSEQGAAAEDPFAAARNRMVDEEIVAAGVTNERVIQSLRTTPRHEFVLLKDRRLAYFDMAIAIGEQQTISPPFVVAYMTEQLDPQPTDKVLEIGTGSGYQAAVLSPLVDEVYTIEIVESLGKRAARTLEHLGYDNVHTRIGDGYLGWPEKAPFDKIIVTCSPENVPQPLVDQLREGGRMIVPVGERYSQSLYLFTKKDGQLESEALRPTLFVPMTGEAERLRQKQPDPASPSIVNGGFEDVEGEDESAVGWHYQRQMRVAADDSTPEGERYAVFTNREPGRGCRALQGFAVDGRKVPHLDVSFVVSGKEIAPGPDRTWPHVVVTFYDERRAVIGHELIGPFAGTFDWRQERKQVPVPLRAREAILRIGLLGAVGELRIDDVRVGR